MKVIQNDGLDFVCETDAELWRARTLLTKEPGTIAWLKTLRLGDVFYDVGANVGCYTLYAARQVGPDGRVYAFEPHVGTALALLRNIARNGFEERVRVFTCAVGEGAGIGHRFSPFYYQSLMSGSTGSQMGHAIDERGDVFVPSAVELKPVTSLAQLINTAEIGAPAAVKIDVDGNEFDVLMGLFGYDGPPPRTVQVETRPSNRASVHGFMLANGYEQTGRHRTRAGEQQVQSGASPDAITDNTVYQRVS